MDQRTARVLLITAKAGERRLVEEALAGQRLQRYRLETVGRLGAGIERATRGGVDLVLLDLDLPDSGGIATFQQFAAVAQSVPVIVLSSSPDEEAAGAAGAAGAQGYLVRQPGLEQLLPRVVAYALERHRLQAELRDWSLFDELTELFNRRGFFMLAEQQLKLSQRTKLGWLVFMVDIDAFKRINDEWGHAAGDQALMDVAQVLRQAFRGSDIIARLGGDEFVCCAIGASLESAEPLLRRLEEQVQAANALNGRAWTLSLSVGHSWLGPGKSVAGSTAEADTRMYEAKARKATDAA